MNEEMQKFIQYLAEQGCNVCGETITSDEIAADQIISPATDVYAHRTCYAASGRHSHNIMEIDPAIID